VTGTGRYVFAIARDLRADDLVGTPGIDGAPLQVVEDERLSAVVCDVDLGEFGQDSLAANLEDLAWVERVARAHNEVVWRVASHATCAPLRLVTVCSDDDSVRAKVDGLRADLEQVLDRVEGRQEWSLKVLVPHRPAPEPEAVPAASGSDYLRRKREAADRRRGRGEAAAAAADEVDEVARHHAVAARRLAPQDPRLTGRADTMVLNGAYLVEAGADAPFRAAVQDAAERRPEISVELAGPWPPYSFAVLG
jgi:hypothetical protein